MTDSLGTAVSQEIKIVVLADDDQDGVANINDAFLNDASETVASAESGVGANMMAQFTIYDNLDFTTPTTDLTNAYNAGDPDGVTSAKATGDAEKTIAEACKDAAEALITDSTNAGGTPSTEQIAKKDTIVAGINSLLANWQSAKDSNALVDTDTDGTFDNLDAFPNDRSEDTRANSDPSHADYNVGANMSQLYQDMSSLKGGIDPLESLAQASYDTGDVAALTSHQATAQVKYDAAVPVSYTHLTLPTICSV